MSKIGMKVAARTLWCAGLVAMVLGVAVSASAETKTIRMQVGEVQEYPIALDSKVIPGEGAADMVTIDRGVGQDVLIFRPSQTGVFWVTVRSSAGTVEYKVVVSGGGEASSAFESVKRLLGDVEGIDIRVDGDRVIIDGESYTEKDYERVGKVAEDYENVFSYVTRSGIAELVPSVMLRFDLVEISREASSVVGINWGSDPIATVINFVQNIQAAGLVGGYTEGTFNLEGENSWMKIHDTHVVTTQSGTEATYHRGGQLKIEVSGMQGGSLENVDYGFKVRCLPSIDSIGQVNMELEWERSNLASVRRDTYALDTDSGSATRQVAEGLSLVLGHAIERVSGRSTKGIPGLKDIPGLGILFGSRSFRRGESIAAILITPTLSMGDTQDKDIIQQVMEELEKKEKVPW